MRRSRSERPRRVVPAHAPRASLPAIGPFRITARPQGDGSSSSALQRERRAGEHGEVRAKPFGEGGPERFAPRDQLPWIQRPLRRGVEQHRGAPKTRPACAPPSASTAPAPRRSVLQAPQTQHTRQALPHRAPVAPAQCLAGFVRHRPPARPRARCTTRQRAETAARDHSHSTHAADLVATTARGLRRRPYTAPRACPDSAPHTRAARDSLPSPEPARAGSRCPWPRPADPRAPPKRARRTVARPVLGARPCLLQDRRFDRGPRCGRKGNSKSRAHARSPGRSASASTAQIGRAPRRLRRDCALRRRSSPAGPACSWRLRSFPPVRRLPLQQPVRRRPEGNRSRCAGAGTSCAGAGSSGTR